MANERVDFDETEVKPIAGRVDFDESEVKPVRQVGPLESTLRTIKESARLAMQNYDVISGSLKSVLSGSKAPIYVQARTPQGPKEDEEFNTAGALAGGVFSLPTEIGGGFGTQHGTERGIQLQERGATPEQVQRGAIVSGGVHAALNALPVKAGGVVGRAIEGKVGSVLGGAATGGAIGAAGGAAGNVAENAALPEGQQFEDLKQESTAASVATDAGMAALLGGGASALAARKARKAATAKATENPPLPVDKMTDLGEGKYRTPNGVEITKEEWDSSTKRVREGWLEEAPKEEKPSKVPDEIDRLKQEHPTGPVADALKEVQAKRDKAVKVKADAEELRRAAEQTTDAEIKKTLNSRADKLDPPEKIPTGEAKEGQPEIKTEQPKKLPVGEATDVPEPYEGSKIPKAEAAEKLPTGEATEIEPIPTGEAKEVTRSGAEPAVPVGESKELYVPPEKRNAADQVVKQEGVQQERVKGNEVGAPAEAGAGNRVLDAAEGKGKETLASLEFPRIDEALIDHQQREKTRAEPPPKPEVAERGRRQTRATIEKGIADGTLDKDGGALALWALDKNPNMARGLHTRISEGKPGDNAKATYEVMTRVVDLFKGKVHTEPLAATHEIMHHTERMMPKIVQDGIRREWSRALDKEMRRAPPKQRAALKSIRDSMGGGVDAFERMKQAFKDNVLDRGKHYQLVNPSEYWAENASRILNERYASRGSWREQAVRWTREMIEHVKGSIGLRSDAPVLKALAHVLDPHANTGRDRTPVHLARAEANAKIGGEERLAAIGGPTKRVLPEETTGKGYGGERAERHWFDRFNRVLKLQETQPPKSSEADIYGANREFQGRAQHRGDVLERDYVKPLGQKLEEAAKLKVTLEDAGDYLNALHAPERNREIAKINPKLPDGGSGMTNKQAQKIVNSFTPEQRAKLDEISKTVQGMNKVKLKNLLDDGLISQELHDALERKYKHYVPLKSLEDEDSFTGIGQGYSLRANDIKEALGRTSKASNPIVGSLMDAARSIVRGEKARVGKAVWKYASDADAHDFMRPYDEANPPKEVLTQKKGVDGKVKAVVDANKVRDMTIDVVIDGEQKKVFVADSLLRDQIRNLASANDPGPALAAVGRVTGAIGRTLTEYNPPFGAANSVKDAITIGLRAKAHGLDPAQVIAAIPDAWKAIGQHKLDPHSPDAAMYREFLENGGKTGAYGITDFAHTQRKLARLGAQLDEASKTPNAGVKATAKAVRKAGEYLSNFNEFAEYGGRFAVYREMRAKGETPRASIEAAKEITVNFNRSGEYGRALNSVLVFTNAALQGLRNTVIYAKHPAVQRGILYMAAAGAASEAWNETFGGTNKETGELNAASQNDKVSDKNLSMLVPGSRKGFKIPLPPEYALPFTLGRRLYRGLAQGNWAREAGGMVAATIDAAAPVRLPDTDSHVGSVMGAVAFTAVKPFYELLGDNKSFFNTDIVPDRHDDSSPAPYYKTARRTTSEIAKVMSKFANDWTGGDAIKPGLSEATLGPLIAPEGIEHIVGYYTGGIGQTVMQSTNLVKGATKGEEVDVNKVPFVNRFAFDEPKSYTSRRYKELKSVFEYAADYDKASQQGKADPKALRALGEYKGAEHELRVLFKQLKTAEGEEKAQVEKEIKATQSRVIKAYNGQVAQ